MNGMNLLRLKNDTPEMYRMKCDATEPTNRTSCSLRRSDWELHFRGGARQAAA